MTEQMKKALEKDKNQLYADDYCYIDLSDYDIDISDRSNRWIGDRLEEAAKHFFDKGADSYRNNVWHDVNEPPICGDSLVTTIIVKFKNKKSFFPYFLTKGTSWSNITMRDEIDKWAYLEDLLPDKNM